ERHAEPFRNATKRHADLETLLVDSQVPELVLEHDRHLGRELGQKPWRHAHALSLRIEGDVEMVLARQPVLGGIVEHRAHHATQRLLRKQIVADVIDGHNSSLQREPQHVTMLACPAASTSTVLCVATAVTRGQRPAAKPVRRSKNGKWRLLLPGASEPRLPELNPSGL